MINRITLLVVNWGWLNWINRFLNVILVGIIQIVIVIIIILSDPDIGTILVPVVVQDEDDRGICRLLVNGISEGLTG